MSMNPVMNMHSVRNTANVRLLAMKERVSVFLVTKKLTDNVLKVSIKYIYINIILTIRNNRSKIVKLYYSKKNNSFKREYLLLKTPLKCSFFLKKSSLMHVLVVFF